MPWLCNYSEAILNNFLKGLEEMNNANEQKTYVCKRARMCSFLIEKGFTPYKVAPDRDNPMYDVFLFTASSELYEAVMEYINNHAERRANK